MEKLKEYAGVIVAVMTVAAALSALVLWAIQIQIVPEIRRLDARIESVRIDLTDRMDRMEERIDARFERIDARFDRIDARLTRAEGDIKTILLRLPRPNSNPPPEARPSKSSARVH